MSKWIPFQDVDFNDNSVMQYHVDTRDFHCKMIAEPHVKKFDFATLLKYGDRFFYTAGEVQLLLNRLFTDSGGKFDWRFLSLTTYKEWLKYIRVFRTPHGMVITGGNEDKALSKPTLSGKVNQEHLSAHND